jgi:hypothetical protein
MGEESTCFPGICTREFVMSILRLQKNSHLRDIVFEVHPEVSFRALKHGVPVVAAKRNPKCDVTRRSLVGNHFGSGAFDEI